MVTTENHRHFTIIKKLLEDGRLGKCIEKARERAVRCRMPARYEAVIKMMKLNRKLYTDLLAVIWPKYGKFLYLLKT